LIRVVVVTHDSASVIESCLLSLTAAAPRRGLEIVVVDNASTDGSADLAAARVGVAGVRRLPLNLGFAAGVNAGFAGFEGAWFAVLNPDTVLPRGVLDVLTDALESCPRAGLVAPRVRDLSGGVERTVGRFPTLARERAHAMFLDRLGGLEGRHAPFPRHLAEVDWVSGCAWLLRAEALRSVGPLDEGYFMYVEDVDYCRRLRDAGWSVLALPEAEVLHARGGGSRASAALPADGGPALLRYFTKFHPDVVAEQVRVTLARGWRLRRLLHRVLGALGRRRSRVMAGRYALALAMLARTRAAPIDHAAVVR